MIPIWDFCGIPIGLLWLVFFICCICLHFLNFLLDSYRITLIRFLHVVLLVFIFFMFYRIPIGFLWFSWVVPWLSSVFLRFSSVFRWRRADDGRRVLFVLFMFIRFLIVYCISERVLIMFLFFCVSYFLFVVLRLLFSFICFVFHHFLRFLHFSSSS